MKETLERYIDDYLLFTSSLANEFYLLQFVLFVFDFEQDVCKTTIFYAEQMCKRVVNAQGGNILHSYDKEGFGSSLNDGIYVRGRRRGKYRLIQL